MRNEPFELGICMAGAVSAGAYTAGVMDFLIEALDTWEQKRGEKDVPTHQVVVKAIGGASAGGMTGIIAASALNNPIEHVKEADLKNVLKEQTKNKFYNSWVDLLQEDMFSLLLKTDDIEKAKVYSLLNSKFIEQVGKKSLKVNSSEFIERKYIEKHIKVFTTLTNVEGFKYNSDFQGTLTDNNFHLSHHADYATFILNKIETQYDNDGWIPLDFFENVNTNMALDAAMATGAFPVGLRSRKITRKKKYVEQLSWNKALLERFELDKDPYEALILDGGIINNEPFERLKNLINGIDAEEDKFKGTVLMIDPFPSYMTSFNIEADDITSSLTGMLSAMLGHLRSKPEVIKKIFKDGDVSQYQIAPVRYDKNDKKIEGKKAIACGFMGGFGGFIHKEFRVHDFFLGRANCERFLREYFTVDVNTTNSIFKNGYKDIDPQKHTSSNGKRQIIPILTTKRDKMYMPIFENRDIWPKRKEKDVDRFNRDLRKRVGKIIMNFSDYNWSTRLFLGIGNKLILRRKLAKAVMNTIKDDMKSYDLL